MGKITSFSSARHPRMGGPGDGKGSCVRSGAGGVLGLAVREQVVNALSDAGLADDASALMLMLEMIRDDLGYSLTVVQHPVGRDTLFELVNACAKTDGGMQVLAHVVGAMRPGSPECVRVHQLVYEPRVLDLLPAPELARLREWLTGQCPDGLTIMMRKAVGKRPPSVARPDDAWHAFTVLADFNADLSGVPPALLFLELLADEIGDGLAEDLRHWNANQARRLRLEAELELRRSDLAKADAEPDRLYLMIMVEPDGIDDDRFRFSHWRQELAGQWPPPRGPIRSVSRVELERAVDALVLETEEAWSEHRGEVALEFVLPRSLLNLSVHLWRKEHDSGDPKPLFLDYPIVIRSLERMTSRHWHRVWHQRWTALMEDPSAGRVYFADEADVAERLRLDAILADQRWAVLVLPVTPPEHPWPGGDALGTALRSGVPALLWHPEASPGALREVVGELVAEGVGDLPKRAQASRLAAFREASTPFDLNVARDLVVLWDDPRRLVFLDPAPGHPRPTGGTADERDRRS